MLNKNIMKNKYFIYTFDHKGIIITNYLGTDAIVDVPSVIDGNPVFAIGYGAFKYSNITQINLPEGLCEIHCRAFYNCHQLESIVLPESLSYLEQSAFSYCDNLKKVTFLKEFDGIDKSAFDSSDAIEEIDFFAWKYLEPKQLKNIIEKTSENFNQLSDCEQNKIITFIKRRHKLKKELFFSDKSHLIQLLFDWKINIDLHDINLAINHSINEKKTNITAIWINYKNTNFSENEIATFDENNELVEIGLQLPTLKQFKTKWECRNTKNGLHISGYKGDKTHETIPLELACGTKITALKFVEREKFNGLVKLIIEAEITEIPHSLFSHNFTLEEIIFPDTLTCIEHKTFEFCQNLKSVVIPDNVTDIGYYAFYDCTSLANIQLSKKLNIIYNDVFRSCSSLESIVIPDGVTVINGGVFEDCTSLKTVEFSKNVTNILDDAFRNCHNLESITNTENVIDINVRSFDNCYTLADENGLVIVNNILCQCLVDNCKIIVPEGVKRICKFAFHSKNNIEVVFPESVKFICNWAFYSCENIIKIETRSDIILEDSFFYDCTFL